MSDSERLRRKIARLRDDLDPDGTGWRRLRPAGKTDLAGLLLREIAETVLHRRLLIDTGSGAPLAIEAAGGRVLELEAGSLRLTGRGSRAAEDIDSFAAALAAALEKALSGRTELRIRTTRPGGKPGADDLRCPPDLIAHHLKLLRHSGPKGLAALVSALGEAVHDWVLLDPAGQVSDSAAPAGGASDLAELAAEDPISRTARLDVVLGGGGAPGWTLLGPAGQGRALLVARAEGEILLALIGQPAVDDLPRHWRAVTGG